MSGAASLSGAPRTLTTSVRTRLNPQRQPGVRPPATLAPCTPTVPVSLTGARAGVRPPAAVPQRVEVCSTSTAGPSSEDPCQQPRSLAAAGDGGATTQVATYCSTVTGRNVSGRMPPGIGHDPMQAIKASRTWVELQTAVLGPDASSSSSSSNGSNSGNGSGRGRFTARDGDSGSSSSSASTSDGRLQGIDEVHMSAALTQLVRLATATVNRASSVRAASTGASAASAPAMQLPPVPAAVMGGVRRRLWDASDEEDPAPSSPSASNVATSAFTSATTRSSSSSSSNGSVDACGPRAGSGGLAAFCSQLCSLAEGLVRHCRARQLANMTWAVAKLYTAQAPESGQRWLLQGKHAEAALSLFRTLLRRCKKLFSSLAPQEASMLVYAAALVQQRWQQDQSQRSLGTGAGSAAEDTEGRRQAGSRAGSGFEAGLARCTRQRRSPQTDRLDSSGGGQATTSSPTSSGRSGVSEEDDPPVVSLHWVSRWMEASEPLLPQMSPQALSNCAWALAVRLGPGEVGLEGGFGDTLGTSASGASMGRRGWWEVVESDSGAAQAPQGQECGIGALDANLQANTRGPGGAPAPGATTIRAASLETVHGWLRRFCNVTAGQLGEWPTASLAVVAWAFAKLQFMPPQPWLGSFLAASYAQLPRMSSHDLSNVAWAAACWQTWAGRAAYRASRRTPLDASPAPSATSLSRSVGDAPKARLPDVSASVTVSEFAVHHQAAQGTAGLGAFSAAAPAASPAAPAASLDDLEWDLEDDMQSDLPLATSAAGGRQASGATKLRGKASRAQSRAAVTTAVVAVATTTGSYNDGEASATDPSVAECMLGLHGLSATLPDSALAPSLSLRPTLPPTLAAGLLSPLPNALGHSAVSAAAFAGQAAPRDAPLQEQQHSHYQHAARTNAPASGAAESAGRGAGKKLAAAGAPLSLQAAWEQPGTSALPIPRQWRQNLLEQVEKRLMAATHLHGGAVGGNRVGGPDTRRASSSSGSSSTVGTTGNAWAASSRPVSLRSEFDSASTSAPLSYPSPSRASYPGSSFGPTSPSAWHLQPQSLAVLCWSLHRLRLQPQPWASELLINAALRGCAHTALNSPGPAPGQGPQATAAVGPLSSSQPLTQAPGVRGLGQGQTQAQGGVASQERAAALGPRALTSIVVLLAGLPADARPKNHGMLHALMWAAAGSSLTASPPKAPESRDAAVLQLRQQRWQQWQSEAVAAPQEQRQLQIEGVAPSREQAAQGPDREQPLQQEQSQQQAAPGLMRGGHVRSDSLQSGLGQVVEGLEQPLDLMLPTVPSTKDASQTRGRQGGSAAAGRAATGQGSTLAWEGAPSAQRGQRRLQHSGRAQAPATGAAAAASGNAAETAVDRALSAVRLLWTLSANPAGLATAPGAPTARKLWRVASAPEAIGQLPANALCRLLVAAARLGFRPSAHRLAAVVLELRARSGPGQAPSESTPNRREGARGQTEDRQAGMLGARAGPAQGQQLQPVARARVARAVATLLGRLAKASAPVVHAEPLSLRRGHASHQAASHTAAPASLAQAQQQGQEQGVQQRQRRIVGSSQARGRGAVRSWPTPMHRRWRAAIWYPDTRQLPLGFQAAADESAQLLLQLLGQPVLMAGSKPKARPAPSPCDLEAFGAKGVVCMLWAAAQVATLHRLVARKTSVQPSTCRIRLQHWHARQQQRQQQQQDDQGQRPATAQYGQVSVPRGVRQPLLNTRPSNAFPLSSQRTGARADVLREGPRTTPPSRGSGAGASSAAPVTAGSTPPPAVKAAQAAAQPGGATGARGGAQAGTGTSSAPMSLPAAPSPQGNAASRQLLLGAWSLPWLRHLCDAVPLLTGRQLTMALWSAARLYRNRRLPKPLTAAFVSRSMALLPGPSFTAHQLAVTAHTLARCQAGPHLPHSFFAAAESAWELKSASSRSNSARLWRVAMTRLSTQQQVAARRRSSVTHKGGRKV